MTKNKTFKEPPWVRQCPECKGKKVIQTHSSQRRPWVKGIFKICRTCLGKGKVDCD